MRSMETKHDEERCESCKNVQAEHSRRKIPKMIGTYDSFSDTTEEDWASEVFPAPNIGVGPIWTAPNDYGIILFYKRNKELGEDRVRRAIEKFSGREGLQSQNKLGGDVYKMDNTRWSYYPIIGEQAGKDDKADEKLFHSLVTDKQYATMHKIKELAIPKMKGFSGIVTKRTLIYFLANIDIHLTTYKSGMPRAIRKYERETHK